MAFHLCCFYVSTILIVGVPFSFGVEGRMWNSIVSAPDHCLFIYIGVVDDVNSSVVFLVSPVIVRARFNYQNGPYYRIGPSGIATWSYVSYVTLYKYITIVE